MSSHSTGRDCLIKKGNLSKIRAHNGAIMAKSLNKVMLIGNLGKDPEVRFTTSGIASATFSVATNEAWKDSEGNLQERTEWHNIVVWRKQAEFAGEYLKKGRKVFIEGRIQTRSWDDKTTGQKRYMTEVVADNIILLDSRGAGDANSGGGAEYSQGGSQHGFGGRGGRAASGSPETERKSTDTAGTPGGGLCPMIDLDAGIAGQRGELLGS